MLLYTLKRGGDGKVAIDLAAECVTATAFYAEAHSIR
jgi:hypothetical protein